MAFLTINGWEIPVEEVTEQQEILGGATRTLGGNLIANQKYKRKWAIRTTIMHPNDAYALKAILTGIGDHWGFDNLAGINGWDNTLSNFFVSDKGLVADSGIATYRPFEGPNKLHAVAIEKGTTNILPDDNTASFETDLSGWTRYFENVNILNISGGAYHGSKYLSVRPISGDRKWGIETTVTHSSIVPGASITFSWYDRHGNDLSNVSGSGIYAPPAIIFLRSDDTEISRESLTNLGGPTDVWHRHSITTTVPNNTAKVKLRIGFDTPDISMYRAYDLDAIQLEVKSFPSSFTLPSSSRSPNIITVPNFSAFNQEELTISFATYLFYDTVSGIPGIIAIRGSTLYSNYVFYLGVTNSPPNTKISIHVYSKNNALFTYTTNVEVETNQWNSFCAVFNYKKQTLKLFKNGQIRWSTSVDYELHPSANSLSFGWPTVISILLSNVFILPFAVSDATAIALTSSSVPVRTPYVTISGDMVNDQMVYCLPTLEDTEYIYYSHAGVWTKGEKISFTLSEV